MAIKMLFVIVINVIKRAGDVYSPALYGMINFRRC